MPKVSPARPAATRSGPVLQAGAHGGNLFLNNALKKQKFAEELLTIDRFYEEEPWKHHRNWM
jgi:hypothetical protein